MANPSPRGSGSAGSSGTANLTVTTDNPAVDGDLILIVVNVNNASSGTHPTPASTGFTSLGTSTAGVWSRTTCLGRMASSNGTSYVISGFSGADSKEAFVFIIKDVAATLPTNIVTTPDASSNTTFSIPAITTVAVNSLDVACVGYGGNNSEGPAPNLSSWGGSLSVLVDVAFDVGGGLCYAGLGVATAIRASAGLQAATSVTAAVADVSAAIRIEVLAASAGPTAGTLAQTEGADTVISAGVLPIAGTFGATEAGDALSSAGVLPVQGSLAGTEAGDSLTGTGALAIVGAFSTTEQADALMSAAVLPIAAALSLTETADSLLATGGVGAVGTLVISEEADALSATGALSIAGAFAGVEQADTLNGTASIFLLGNLAVTEQSDTLSADAVLLLQGALFRTEEKDTLTAVSALSIAALFAAVEGDDTLVATAGGSAPFLPSPTQVVLLGNGVTQVLLASSPSTATLSHNGATTA